MSEQPTPGWEIENELAKDYGWEPAPDAVRGYGWCNFSKGDERIWVRGDICIRARKVGDRFEEHRKFTHLEAALNNERGSDG